MARMSDDIRPGRPAMDTGQSVCYHTSISRYRYAAPGFQKVKSSYTLGTVNDSLFYRMITGSECL